MSRLSAAGLALASIVVGLAVGFGLAAAGRVPASAAAAVASFSAPSAGPAIAASSAPLPAPTLSLAPSPTASPQASVTPAAPPPPAPTPTATPYSGPVTRIVPVLMYHRIADPPPGTAYLGLYVSPASFDAQMAALHRAGWHTITAGELGAAMAADQPVPIRTFVVTFDDGYQDNVTEALPILERYGFRATFSVVAAAASTMMTSPQLAQLVAAGMEIGNHTLSHANVSRLWGALLEEQIIGGAARIESRLASQGVQTVLRTFVYPSGHVGQAALDLLAQSGYTDAFTEVPGFAVIGATPPLQIPRVRVSRFETLAMFLGRMPQEPPRP